MRAYAAEAPTWPTPTMATREMGLLGEGDSDDIRNEQWALLVHRARHPALHLFYRAYRRPSGGVSWTRRCGETRIWAFSRASRAKLSES